MCLLTEHFRTLGETIYKLVCIHFLKDQTELHVTQAVGMEQVVGYPAGYILGVR